jgi:23S rRNA (cytidine1920-2'-O)/16S rRNA (cytidine1409-2'-O)-methyltransferase
VSRRLRLDSELVRRGLARSWEQAAQLIETGRVSVGGRRAAKPATQVDTASAIVVAESDDGPDYVSRGAHKLVGALDTFGGLSVEGRRCLDAGASTGGFTDVLLQRGAPRVVALDVGHNQIDWKLRSDPRVTVLERINARHLVPDQLPPDLRTFDIVTIDVSFISLRHILPVVPPLLNRGADVIALVKPQFEAGRPEIGKGGIVRDEGVRARVVEDIARAADALGLSRVGLTDSPIAGMEGNKEFLMHLRLSPMAAGGSPVAGAGE